MYTSVTSHSRSKSYIRRKHGKGEIDIGRTYVSGPCWYMRSRLAAENRLMISYDNIMYDTNQRRKKAQRREGKNKREKYLVENEARKMTHQQWACSEV